MSAARPPASHEQRTFPQLLLLSPPPPPPPPSNKEPATMSSPLKGPSVVPDSQGDSDSDYDFEHDLARFRSRQAAFASELQRRSVARAMPSRKRPTASLPSSPSSPSSLSSLADSDGSDGDLAVFLKPANNKSSLRASAATPPKLSISEILALTRKNKARDDEISRARRLLEAEKPGQTNPVTVNVASTEAPETKDGQEAITPSVPKSSLPKPSQPDRQWSFFGPAPDLSQSSFRQLREAWRETLARSYLELPEDSHDTDGMIRDLLVSGCITDALSVGSLQLVPALHPLLLDELCLESDQGLSTAYLGVIMADRNHFDKLINEDTIKRLFTLIGGSDHALDLSLPLHMSPREDTGSGDQNASPPVAPSWWNVSLVLRLFAKIAQGLTPEQLRVLWGLVVRLSLDEQRTGDRKCHVDLLELMEALMDKFESCEYSLVEVGNSIHLTSLLPQPSADPQNSAQSVLADTKASVVDRTLQIRTLDMIPVTSTFSHKFRRRLALVFFSNKSLYLQKALEPDILISSIVDALDGPDVNPPKGETYSRVQNILDMINIVIDDAKWCSRVVTAASGKEPELLLDRLVSHLKHSKESIHEANDLNIEKSDAKDSFTKMILRLQCLRPRTKAAQTVMERYFRQDTAVV
ncbi:hypothetical protein Dda_3502 [Drechslerella dactyloides]|uniref:Uncharacterized protein n=1 Tax=Drechslerella dactyloides TaxID=74499 RepID=A0AAD6IYJ6_DREDA|nr:hypothetical protein Dda_3502 [Drechslerella dactyloides]